MVKFSVGILGATGMVGQKFIELLQDHPWFEIVALAASDRSVGKSYDKAMQWRMASSLSPKLAKMTIQTCKPTFSCDIVFSGLDSSVAGKIEIDFAKAGYIVISNSKNHRMDPTVPLLVPEINHNHLQLTSKQSYGTGMIVTNPNCSVVGILMALKPLIDNWGISSIHAVTLQAISGAGYPGVASLDVIDNVVPYIEDEEDKIETEPNKIFGTYVNGHIQPANISISSQCTRVPVIDGHIACLSVKLNSPATEQELIASWNNFSGRPQELKLPSAPINPIHYFSNPSHPQPRLHRYLENGMAVSVGRLRPCPLFDWKFVVLSHNTVRGAAGGAILNAELMIKEGLING